jgi:hypothetical protein
MQAIKIEATVEKEEVNEEEWQQLIDMIRGSEPPFSTLDAAMDFSRGRLITLLDVDLFLIENGEAYLWT